MTAQGYTGLGGVSDVFFGLMPGSAPAVRGRLFYDSRDEVDALSFYDIHTGAPPMHLGRELIVPGYNSSGADIPTGAAVYANGNHAGTRLPTVALAQANAEATSEVLGLAAGIVPNNSVGHFHLVGVLHNDISLVGFPAGAALYLSPTVAGGWEVVKPSAPNFVARLGVVTRTGANGSIFVNIRQGVAGV